jgi:hypothetical protein
MHLCHQKPNPARETVPLRTDSILAASQIKFYHVFSPRIPSPKKHFIATIYLTFLLCLQRETESQVPIPELEEDSVDLPRAKPNPPATRQNGAASKNKKKNQ